VTRVKITLRDPNLNRAPKGYPSVFAPPFKIGEYELTEDSYTVQCGLNPALVYKIH